MEKESNHIKNKRQRMIFMIVMLKFLESFGGTYSSSFALFRGEIIVNLNLT